MKKNKYETPLIIPLGELVSGSGACQAGARVAGPNCKDGQAPGNQCSAGGTAGNRCTGGATATSTCKSGVNGT